MKRKLNKNKYNIEQACFNLLRHTSLAACLAIARSRGRQRSKDAMEWSGLMNPESSIMFGRTRPVSAAPHQFEQSTMI
jgi:hypothetical protein